MVYRPYGNRRVRTGGSTLSYLTSTVNDRELYRRFALFGQCSGKAKASMFLAAARNDLRSLTGHQEAQASNMIEIASKTSSPEANLAVQFRDVGILASGDLQSYMHAAAADVRVGKWAQGLSALIKASCSLAGENRWLQSTLTNLALVDQGLCPLIHFAFGCWQVPVPDPQSLELARTRWLVEFAPMYLYRLAPRTTSEVLDGREIGRGAYCSILEFDNKVGVVIKVPRNLAGEIIAQQEKETHEALGLTILHNNIPRLLGYNRPTGKIMREYVKGPLGHELLVKGQLKWGETKVKKLKWTFEKIISAMHRINLRLDIHPSNFVWDELCKRWVLIDLGPVPVIGFNYYPLDSFEEYWMKVWEERLVRMCIEPIRSVYLG